MYNVGVLLAVSEGSANQRYHTLIAGPESEHKLDFNLEFKKITTYLSNLLAWILFSLYTTFHHFLYLGAFWVVEELNGDQQIW